MPTEQALFECEPRSLSGFSNERYLARICPEEFKLDNPWSNCAEKFFEKGGKTVNWKWKSKLSGDRGHQFDCLRALIFTFSLSPQDKRAVAGWMLSEMLEEVPEYTPM